MDYSLLLYENEEVVMAILQMCVTFYVLWCIILNCECSVWMVMMSFILVSNKGITFYIVSKPASVLINYVSRLLLVL
jgi:hypothetical protein